MDWLMEYQLHLLVNRSAGASSTTCMPDSRLRYSGAQRRGRCCAAAAVQDGGGVRLGGGVKDNPSVNVGGGGKGLFCAGVPCRLGKYIKQQSLLYRRS